jgi:Swt1-like HEPN
MSRTDELYAFAYKGLLARQAVADHHESPRSDAKAERIASRLPLRLLDDAIVIPAREMAVVYTAIAAFENAAREFVEKRLIEEVGSNWWEQCVPEKRRQKAESRREEENRVRWHAKRGESFLQYTELEDLSAIIVTNHERFVAIIQDAEWVKQIFKTVERSRNIIMHSGYLEAEDIERLGMALRDWLAQVGG